MSISVALSNTRTLRQLNGKHTNLSLLTVSGLSTEATATGLTINTTAVGGKLTAGTIAVAGTGYTVGQLVGVAGGTGGLFTVTGTTTPSSGIPNAIALYAAGTGYTSASPAATVSYNSIPHGLPTTPTIVDFQPQSATSWGMPVVPDATNIYVDVPTSGSTSGWITAFYGRV